MNNQTYSTYMLLDASLMPDVANAPWMRDRRCRGWMERIYDRTAAVVSPVLVDIEAAYRSNRIPEMMDFVGASDPKFHVSFINTQISLEEMVCHLRRLIYFVNEQGEEFTLRFADGAVLLALSKVLTPDQWKSFHGPVMNWLVHNRQSQLTSLQTPTSEKNALLPLVLNNSQIAQLKEEMAIYQLLANVRKTRSDLQENITFSMRYEWVGAANNIWLASGQHDNTTLWMLIKGIFDTNGTLLRLPNLSKIISNPDLNEVKASLKKVISFCKGGSV